jgi:acyl carrier protein
MMSNREKYENVFIESFSVEKDMLNEKFVYQCIPAWDSVGHMAMISALEEAFGIMLEMDDIIDFSSFHKGIETLAKYGIDI